jgi:hypothetical protein
LFWSENELKFGFSSENRGFFHAGNRLHALPRQENAIMILIQARVGVLKKKLASKWLQFFYASKMRAIDSSPRKTPK